MKCMWAPRVDGGVCLVYFFEAYDAYVGVGRVEEVRFPDAVRVVRYAVP